MKRQKSDGVYFFWSAAMLVSVLLAVFVLMFTSCSGGEKKEKDSPEPSVSASAPAQPDVSSQPAPPEGNGGEAVPPDTTDQPQTDTPTVPASAMLTETEDMGQEYIDKMYFMGDSTTHGLASYGVIPEARVWTPQNGTLSLFRWNVDQISLTDEGTTMFMNDAVALKKPEYLLITLGVNGVGVLDEEQFKSYYNEMVDSLIAASPDTKIILNSIYPVGRTYAEKSITNEKINAANGWIQGIAEAKGLRYLDSASVLKDSEGFMAQGYDNGDGLHPTKESYDLVINYIRTHGYPAAAS